MSARALHVRIGRLVVDEPLRGEAARWGDAIQRALHTHVQRAPDAKVAAASAESHATDAIAQQVARRIGAALPTTSAQPSGARHAGA